MEPLIYKPLIKALRSDDAMPQQVRDDLAHFLNQIISFKLRRPPGRPRTVGAAARMLMHWKGDGLRLWTANRDVERDQDRTFFRFFTLLPKTLEIWVKGMTRPSCQNQGRVGRRQIGEC